MAAKYNRCTGTTMAPNEQQLEWYSTVAANFNRWVGATMAATYRGLTNVAMAVNYRGWSGAVMDTNCSR